MDFLQTLYQNTEDGYLSIWRLDTKLSRYFPVGDLDAALAYSLDVAKTTDVYLGICPRTRALPEHMRGTEADVSCLPALYFDFDVGTEHKQQKLPANFDELDSFIDSLPVPPTMSVHTGNGLHSYWILREPVTDLTQAKELLGGWSRYIIQCGQTIGWKFDNVADLSRVLRVPGTTNYKNGGNKPVTLVFEPLRDSTKLIYNESDFEEFLVPELSADELLLQNYKPAFELPEVIEEGERNNTLFKMASSLRAKGHNEAEIESLLLAANKTRLRSPLPDSEVKTIAKSAGKFEQGTLALSHDFNAEQLAAVDPADLMSEAVLRPVLECRDEIKKHQAIIKLKEKARAARIPIREFDKLIDVVKNAIRNERIEAGAKLEEVVDLPDSLRLPTDWNYSDAGVYKVRMAKGEVVTEWACHHPVLVTQRMCNVDSREEKFLLKFKRDAEWKEVVVPRSFMAERAKLVALSDQGAMFNSENAKYVVQWIEALEAANPDMAKVQSVGRLGWVGSTTFCPYSTDIVFDGDAQYRDMYEAVQSSGSPEEWLKMATQAKEKLFARAALAASFASPLVSILGKPIFFLHFWGTTGSGKTVLLKYAMSVWGNPNVLVRTFNATINGLERLAAFISHLPLCLDEMQTRRDQNGLDYILYALSEGKSKGRATRMGGMEIEQRWQNIILTNGENPITTGTSEGGAKNRSIELYAPTNIFDDAAAVADICSEHYGWAGEEFIAKLMAVPKGEIQKLYQLFRETFKQYMDSYTDKQITALAILCVGDLLSARFVFGQSEEAAMDSALRFGHDLVKHLTSISDVDTVERAYEWVQGWIASNESRLSSTAPNIIGKIDGRNHWIIASQLTEALTEAGYSPRKVIAGWMERGYIDSKGGRPYQKKRIGHMTPNCYVFPEQTLPIMEDPDCTPLNDTDTGDAFHQTQLEY